MKARQGDLLQSLRAVQTFLDMNAHVLSDVVNCGARRKLDELVATIDNHAIAQVASDLAAQSATRTRQTLRTVLLRDHMAPIAEVAAAEGLASPETQPLRMPPRWATPERLRAHAAGMALAAAPFADLFVAAGLPRDFAAQLTAAAGAMIAAVGERKQRRVRRREATVGLRTTLSAARRIVRILDAMVTSALHDDPALLAAWTLAERIGRPPRGAHVAPRPTLLLAAGPALHAAPSVQHEWAQSLRQ